MAVLKSTLDIDSEQYMADRDAMLAALAQVRELAAQVLGAGGERAIGS